MSTRTRGTAAAEHTDRWFPGEVEGSAQLDVYRFSGAAAPHSLPQSEGWTWGLASEGRGSIQGQPTSDGGTDFTLPP